MVINIVASDVAVTWLLEQADLPPTAELLCPLSAGYLGTGYFGAGHLGWCTTEDLHTARVAGTERIGQMSLQRCELIYEQLYARPIAALRCGEFALAISGNWDPENLEVRGEDLLRASSVPAEQVGWTDASELLNAFSGRGPMPPPQPVPVVRGCRAIVTTAICGWWAKLPPPPSPCRNPHLVTHSFV